jgi:hypothetical protein
MRLKVKILEFFRLIMMQRNYGAVQDKVQKLKGEMLGK